MNEGEIVINPTEFFKEIYAEIIEANKDEFTPKEVKELFDAVMKKFM